MKIEETVVYTTKEVAEILKVSLPTIKRMLKDGRLQSARIGRQHRFLGRDLLEILSLRKDLRTAPQNDTSNQPVQVTKTDEIHPPAPEPAAGIEENSGVDVPQLTSIELRQRAYMLGRKIINTLFDDNDNVLFEKDCVVTDEIIYEAIRKKKLMELFSCIEHES